MQLWNCCCQQDSSPRVTLPFIVDAHVWTMKQVKRMYFISCHVYTLGLFLFTNLHSMAFCKPKWAGGDCWVNCGRPAFSYVVYGMSTHNNSMQAGQSVRRDEKNGISYTIRWKYLKAPESLRDTKGFEKVNYGYGTHVQRNPKLTYIVWIGIASHWHCDND